ncbi:FAD-dependent oxidoreductase [Curtobacterium sp. MCBD17_019]|nr:FAD-dependent oxidoreductase [Curtobacterium sp. MCBD17_019]
MRRRGPGPGRAAPRARAELHRGHRRSDGRAGSAAPPVPRPRRAVPRSRVVRIGRLPGRRGGLPALLPLPRDRGRELRLRTRRRRAAAGALAGVGRGTQRLLARAGVRGQRPSRAGPVTAGRRVADVVVLGAGISGTSVALRLAERGVAVTLVDAGLPGRATTAGAGIISPFGLAPGDTDPRWTRVVDAAVARYPGLLRDLGDDATTRADYAIVDEVVVAADEEERGALAALAARAAERDPGGAAGEAPVFLEGRELRERWPAVDPDLQGLLLAGTARVDGHALTAVLLDAAVRSGVEVVPGRAELRRAGSRAIVEVDGAPVVADTVVIATGAWSASMLTTAGVPTSVTADRGQIVHLAAGWLPTERLPVLKTFAGPYVIGFSGGRIVAGATHGTSPDHDAEVRAGDQRTVLQDALRVAPGLTTARIVETRVGLRPASADGFPLVGRSRLDDVFVATGFGSWGLTLGPLLGEVLADQVLGGPVHPVADLVDPLRVPVAVPEGAPGE